MKKLDLKLLASHHRPDQRKQKERSNPRPWSLWSNPTVFQSYSAPRAETAVFRYVVLAVSANHTQILQATAG